MKENVKSIVEALEEVSPYLGKLSPEDMHIRMLHSQLVAFVAFPYIKIKLSEDVRGDIVALRKYLADDVDSFTEKFDKALEPIKGDKLLGENKTISTITQETVETIIKLARHIVVTNR